MSDSPKDDFCVRRVLQNPITTHAFMELLIDRGVELNIDHNTLTHEERVALIYEIIDEVDRREKVQ